MVTGEGRGAEVRGWRWLGDRDVVGLGLEVRSRGPGCGEGDGVGAGLGVGVGRVLEGGGREVAEVPGPGGDGAAGEVGEGDREGMVTGEGRGAEVRRGGLGEGALGEGDPEEAGREQGSDRRRAHGEAGELA